MNDSDQTPTDRPGTEQYGAYRYYLDLILSSVCPISVIKFTLTLIRKQKCVR